MPEIGTCIVCGRRFAMFRLVTSGHNVIVHHNIETGIRCPGAGVPAVDGSVTYQVTGYAIRRQDAD
jgi:hypothetical protein